MEKQSSYTREDMINLLMLFEEEYVEGHKDDPERYMNGKTPKEWLDSRFKEYAHTENNSLEAYFDELTGFGVATMKNKEEFEYYYHKNMKRLEENRDKLWI